MKNLLLVLILVFWSFSASADTISIDANSTGDYPTIQAAINDANDGDVIILQPGIYTGNGNCDIDFNGLAITVRSTNPSDPCVVAATIIDCQGGRYLGSRRGFVFESGENKDSVLNGLKIINGYVNDWDGYTPFGFGGGIYISGSSPTIRNCVISNCYAEVDGGGIYCCCNSNPEFDNCIIEYNSVRDGYGGGIYCHNSSSTITNCLINGNYIIEVDSAFNNGGGVYSWASNITIKGCLISNNSADGYGGGIYCAYQGTTIVSDCTVVGNTASTNGGGIAYHELNNLVIKNSVIKENSANRDGGGIYSSNYHSFNSATITNCTIIGNSCLKRGGGVYIYSESEVANCTFSNNSAETGGGFCYLGNRVPIITHSILWDNSASSEGPEIALLGWNGYSTLSANYNDVKGGQAAIYVESGCSLNWGTENIDADPFFVHPDANDFHLKSQAGRWYPYGDTWVTDTDTSPCIDAGNMANPIGLEPFPNGGIINMGSYGGTSEASKSYFGTTLCETIVAGDINGDCKVDFKDFALMTYHWLENNQE